MNRRRCWRPRRWPCMPCSRTEVRPASVRGSRIQGLPKDRQRVIRNLRSDDIGPFISIDALVTKIASVRPRIHEATFRCTACDHRIQIPQRNEQELIEPLECDPPEEGGVIDARDRRDSNWSSATRG